ncbi:MAG: (Fe-S)-binding protein [Desulfobacteraceae bacterium]|nr:MAG: (Fe-S)-binding protein [Desulfobacteraceae bacterium]
MGTYTVFDLLIKYIKGGRIKLDRSRFKILATYHDPCNYGRKADKVFGHGFFEEPRWILDQCIENWVDLYPTKDNQLCCGGGGGTLTTGYNAERILYGKRKMEQIRATGAEMVVVPCHSCHGQLNSIKKEYDMENLTVKYLWELVSDCLVI